MTLNECAAIVAEALAQGREVLFVDESGIETPVQSLEALPEAWSEALEFASSSLKLEVWHDARISPRHETYQVWRKRESAYSDATIG